MEYNQEGGFPNPKPVSIATTALTPAEAARRGLNVFVLDV